MFFILISLAGLLLSSCGQYGDLYLPNKTSVRHQQSATVKSDTDT